MDFNEAGTGIQKNEALNLKKRKYGGKKSSVLTSTCIVVVRSPGVLRKKRRRARRAKEERGGGGRGAKEALPALPAQHVISPQGRDRGKTATYDSHPLQYLALKPTNLAVCLHIVRAM